jgi:hypothetical protein
MIRHALALLVAPLTLVSAQAATTSRLELEITSDAFRIESAGNQSSGKTSPGPLIGKGKLIYGLAVGDDVTITATQPGGLVHVQANEGPRIVAVAEGRAVTLRNRDGEISVEIQRQGAVPVPAKPPGSDK